jgi:hypothetical protein
MRDVSHHKRESVSLEPQGGIPDELDAGPNRSGHQWGTGDQVSVEGASGNQQPQREAEFDKQKQAFQRIPAAELECYKNQFIVSHNGQVVDHDEDLSALTNRYFARSGDVPVYITRIGEPIKITLRAPLARRI